MVKEFEVCDGYPVLDEYEHTGMDRGGEQDISQRPKPVKIDFRIPIKGLSQNLISPTQLNVCNMFSTLYFMQLVVILDSDSIKIPNKRNKDSIKAIESQPIMLKFIR